MAAPDPITVEVIHNYYLSAAREMERNLMRTSYTTIVYEIRDFGLGIYDRDYRMLAESPGLAIFTCGNDYGLQQSIEFIGKENLEPGDLILTSYPYWSSAHPMDVLATSPIFYKDELIGFTAIKQHWIDLGQKEAGYMLDSTDVFQEGLIMPAMKLYRAGVRNQEIVNLIEFNSRIPDRVIGDMNAQISACRTGERRVAELAERFGLDTLLQSIEAILDHGERLSLSRLAELPNGTWEAEDFVDDDGINRDQLLKLKCKVTVSDDEFIVDWRGSEPTTEGPMNLPIGLTRGVSGLAFKGVTSPDYPANAGHYRPLRVITEEGTMMHAVSPSPTFTIWAALLAPEVILKALSQGMPDKVPACSGGDIFDVMGLGVHPETGIPWLEATNEAIGFGAFEGNDGEDGIMHLSEPGCRNNPVEVLETKGPWIIENYGYRQDSGGPGIYRGGVGVTRTYHFMHDSQALAVVKRTKSPPWGMNGGKDGSPGFVTIWPETERERTNGALHEKDLKDGDVIINSSGGGGGWGDPLERDPQRVLEDVVNEYVSLESARRDYGVVIDEDTLTVDEGATAALRAG
ncbi:MAG: hydantoinase B/oxoprolinase family protein [Anaerolineaceae bacterium]|nr:hydantoinase B/oxoprolinase family protein [Anaerolineaceae bacterium]MCY4024537.1 hydantoinase B/oxoprolinase family protein [Anaerolineaceae bacterium]